MLNPSPALLSVQESHLAGLHQDLVSLDRFLQELLQKMFLYVVSLCVSFYHSLSFSEQIDYAIIHFFPTLCHWIMGWVDVQKSHTLNIKFTTYEEMVADEESFFIDFLQFYNIPRKKWKAPTVPLNNKVRYRKGKTDEWREVFSPDQQAKVTEMMPQEFFERFNWSP